MATSLGEGQVWIRTYKTLHKNWLCVASYSCRGVGWIHTIHKHQFAYIHIHHPFPHRYTYTHSHICYGRHLWCNGYHRRKWTCQPDFKSWTKLFAFQIVLIPSILPPSIGKIVGQTGFFNLGMANSLRKGKLHIKNRPCVTSCSCGEVGKYIHIC